MCVRINKRRATRFFKIVFLHFREIFNSFFTASPTIVYSVSGRVERRTYKPTVYGNAIGALEREP